MITWRYCVWLINKSLKKFKTMPTLWKSRCDLQKSRRNYLGLCPFHGENTSFNAVEGKQFYHCLVVGAQDV